MEGLAPIIGQSLAARRLRELIAQLAPETAPVLISGETGTGKELCARHLHAASARKEQPFVARNCAAFPETLAESELFGHTRGAFTGALRDRKGVFELAHGGTLFLDEIGELSLTLQAKLLRVLQEGVVTPVGSTLDRKVDVRLIAATNRNLREMVRAGQFREDLWYRLNVLHIHIPSLSNRQEDIPLLIQVILEEQGRRRGRTYEIDQSAKRMLCSYPWPGNIRELRNELQRLVILAGERNAPLGPELLSPHIVEAVDTNLSSDGMSGSLRTARERFERTIIEHTLREVGWNKSAAAKRLGMSRTTLIAKAQRYGLTKSFAETRRKR